MGFPLACERRMQAKICIGMSLGIGGDFGNPRARHDDGGGPSHFSAIVVSCVSTHFQ